ncbi:MAG: hypothetical protein IKV10_00260, partial [Alphaproteobacteria bacterium]|nr:hypothetical protein [Alphaproteobacteria bacterium]
NRTAQIQTQIDSWVATSESLSEHLDTEFNKNTEQMKNLNGESETMRGKISELAQSTANGF